MTQEWHYQLRVYLDDAFAAVARTDPDNPAMQPLSDILGRHNATLKSQFDAFADYVSEAERHGTDDFPLYRWTKVTIDDPVKKAKHLKSFALRIDGNEVYPKELADALEADLQPLIGGSLITRLSRHDTNPANNLPVPEHLR